MARSRLFSQLQSLMQVAWLCRRTGEPAAEALPRLREHAARQRRQLLLGAAGVGAASVLPRRAVAAPGAGAADVAIVGAGLAGLVCANQRPGQQGMRRPVASIEAASHRAGGRCRVAARDCSPDRLPNVGGEFIDTQPQDDARAGQSLQWPPARELRRATGSPERRPSTSSTVCITPRPMSSSEYRVPSRRRMRADLRTSCPAAPTFFTQDTPVTSRAGLRSTLGHVPGARAPVTCRCSARVLDRRLQGRIRARGRSPSSALSQPAPVHRTRTAGQKLPRPSACSATSATTSPAATTRSSRRLAAAISPGPVDATAAACCAWRVLTQRPYRRTRTATLPAAAPWSRCTTPSVLDAFRCGVDAHVWSSITTRGAVGRQTALRSTTVGITAPTAKTDGRLQWVCRGSSASTMPSAPSTSESGGQRTSRTWETNPSQALNAQRRSILTDFTGRRTRGRTPASGARVPERGRHVAFLAVLDRMYPGQRGVGGGRDSRGARRWPPSWRTGPSSPLVARRPTVATTQPG